MLYEFRALCTLISGTGVGFPREICIYVYVSVCSRRWHRPITLRARYEPKGIFVRICVRRKLYWIFASLFLSLKWEVWIFSLLLKFYRHFFLFLSLTRLPSEKDSDKLNISLEKILVCRCILILDSHDWFNLIFRRTKSSHELIHLNNESFDIIHQFSIESS